MRFGKYIKTGMSLLNLSSTWVDLHQSMYRLNIEGGLQSVDD